MKIGVMTYWTSENNYGQLLQCYATCEYLKQMGHEPFVIPYDLSKDEQYESPLTKAKVFIKHVMGLAPVKEETAAGVSVDRKFNEFRQECIPFSDLYYENYQALKRNPPCADAYLAGSDQIWRIPDPNIKKLDNIIHAYMLDFGSDDTLRYSFSSSMGGKVIPESCRKEVQGLLDKFGIVTVREEAARDELEKCKIKAQVKADPTLHLDAQTYRELYKSKGYADIPKEAYLVFYWVNNGGEIPYRAVSDYAKRKGLKLIFVTANRIDGLYEQTYPTVWQWLALLDGAEEVITNSFHGTVFSLLFEKKVGVVQISGSNSGMNRRMDSLFDMCHVEARYIDLTDEDFEVKKAQSPRLDNLFKI